VALRRTCRCT